MKAIIAMLICGLMALINVPFFPNHFNIFACGFCTAFFIFNSIIWIVNGFYNR